MSGLLLHHKEVEISCLPSFDQLTLVMTLNLLVKTYKPLLQCKRVGIFLLGSYVCCYKTFLFEPKCKIL